MPEGQRYRSQLSLEASAFLVAQSRRKQRQLLDLADRIAREPFTPGDYQLADEKGRKIEHRLLQGFLFSYQVDHAVGAILITDIIQV